MPNKAILRTEDYQKIEAAVGLKDEEDYVVLAHKRHNTISFSTHVFARLPTAKELVKYEETSSRLKFRGNRAEIEGSSITAAVTLYDLLIDRAYDVPVGRRVFGEQGKGGPLDRDKAKAIVPVMYKREAIREFVGSVQSATSLAESEEEAEVKGKEDD